MGRTTIAQRAARLPTPLTGSQKTRAAAVKQMNDELRKKLERIEVMLGESGKTTIEFYYNLGTMAKEVKQNSKKYGGDAAMALLEQALGVRADLIRRATMFALEYTRSEMQKLTDLYNPVTSYRLNWGHVIVLLSVKNAEQRAKLAKRIVDEMLDAKAAHALIQEKQGRKGAGGRPYKLPPTVPGQLRQVLEKTEDWVMRHELLWNGPKNSAFANIMDYAPDQYDVAMLDQAKQVRASLDQVLALAEDDAKTFDRIIERIENCLKKPKRKSA